MSRLRRLSFGLDDSRRGVLWMLFAMLLFANVNAITKLLTQTYPVTQVVWARFFFHVVLLVVLFRERIPARLASRGLGLQLLRSGLMLATTVLIFVAVHLNPLVETSAMLAIAPVMLTALSWPLLREAVGARRWIAVAVAFAGALVIIRPGAAVMQPAVLVALAAAAVLSLYHATTRLVARRDAVLTTVLHTPLAGFVVSSAAVPFVWTTPGAVDWLLMVALGLFGVGAHFALIKAFDAAPAATVAPFYYVGILWAAAYGFFLFGDVPDAWVVSGSTVIVASGLYIFRREQAGRPPPV